MRAVALLLTLAVGDPRLQTPEAQAAFGEAEQAFAAKDFDKAAEALARVYAIEPLPHLLYARAQAERLAGRCEAANPLYIEYLDTRPSPESAALVRWNLSVCLASMSLDAGSCEQARTQLSAMRPEADGDPTRSEQLADLEARLEACSAPAPEPLPEPEPEPPPPIVVEPPPDPAQPPDRRRVDPWGVGLGAGSLLAGGAAVGLFLAGNAQIDAVSFEGTHARARERNTRGRTMQGAAIGAAATAGALAIGAVVHWLVWRQGDRRATATARR
ncbi:MAG: tetratricopeptide repeat protein [Nannocystaceae bacterium]|nr:hypothetical protein [bacterium]